MTRFFHRRGSLALLFACLLVPALVVVAPGLVSAATSKSSDNPKLPTQTAHPAAAGTAAAVSTASGSAQRTFVSAGSGNDANPCTRTAPCRNFAAAIAQTAAGGEVVALDSGGYGPVTIGSSISLIAPPGVYAGITAFSGNAITINAGSSDTVTLRGLTLTGLGGSSGIQINSAGTVDIQQDTIKGFSAYGIDANPTTGSVTVHVEDTTVTHTGNDGIFLGTMTNGAVVKGMIVNSRFEEGFNGVEAWFQSQVAVQSSVAADNVQVGFYADGDGHLGVDNSLASHNEWGLFSYSVLYASSTLIVRNAVGVAQGGGTEAISWGNNRVGDNDNNGAFGSTIATQ
jgi:hypothetical protein